VILALDTCLTACSAAILDGETVLAARSEAMPRGHQERLAPLVRDLAVEAGVGFSGLTRIGVTVGPGSFTGLRVALAAASSFGLALDIPFIGVSCLTAYAAPLITAGTRTVIASAIDARHGSVFFESYWLDGKRALAPQLLTAREAALTLRGGRSRVIGTGAALVAVAGDMDLPAITRATALSHLRAYLDRDTAAALPPALADADAMVRGAAVEALHAAPPAVQRTLALPMTADPSRIVRLQAAHVLAGTDPASLDASARSRLATAFAEFEQSRRANADRAESRLELGAFLARHGRVAEAEKEMRAAIALQPGFAPAYVSLADLLQETGRDAEVEAELEAGLAHAPGDAALLHAQGLLRVREGKLDAALPLLRRAMAAAPDNPHYAFVHAVALHDSGRPREAIAALEAALVRAPGDPALRSTLDGYRALAAAASASADPSR